MNKLLLFPIGILLLITLYVVVSGGTYFLSDSENISSYEGMEINGTDTGEVYIPQAGTSEFDMWGLQGAIAILLIIMVVGVVAGISVFGSGLKDASINILFICALYLAFWGVLTAVTIDFFSGTEMAFLLYVAMSLMYVIGIGQEISASE